MRRESPILDHRRGHEALGGNLLLFWAYLTSILEIPVALYLNRFISANIRRVGAGTGEPDPCIARRRPWRGAGPEHVGSGRNGAVGGAPGGGRKREELALIAERPRGDNFRGGVGAGGRGGRPRRQCRMIPGIRGSRGGGESSARGTFAGAWPDNGRITVEAAVH